MDTKLKKTHKLATFIIIAVTLIPAIILTALYPKMEEEYIEKKTSLEIQLEENQQSAQKWELRSNFVNYVTEALYYIYGNILEEIDPHNEVNYEVLEAFDWNVDYDLVEANTSYYVEYTNGEESRSYMNTGEDLKSLMENPSQETLDVFREKGNIGYLVIAFDEYGKIKEIEINDLTDGEVSMPDDPYGDVKASIEQYEGNAKEYNSYWAPEEDVDIKQLRPTNLRGVFLIHENSDFISEPYSGMYYYYTSPESIYMENGAVIIVLVFAVLVALAALLLPFVRVLDTGREKLFSMPLEINLILCGLGGGLATFMYLAMCNSRYSALVEAMAQDMSGFEIIGYTLSAELMYRIVLVLNVLGWAACFFMEYIVVAHVRQFFYNPKYYIQNQLLVVRLFRWFVKKGRQCYNWVTSIDIAYNLNRSIVKVVLVNFIILVFLCCMWFFGVFGLILYSIGIYVLLRKYGEKIQRQYLSILKATEVMADGYLKISLEEDLGIFEPIGNGLERLQEGFAKAVKEEAKSQNMKTELITNVSHDLKTPLTAIITYVDLLKQQGITEEERNSYIDVLEQKSRRLKVLIEDLFEVSKANSGNIQMHFMDVDVVNLMKQVRLEMSDKLETSGLVFRWNLPEEHIVLSLDGQRTYRIFENLLNNILKYSLPSSRVYVDIQNMESEVRILFRNISAVELDGNTEKLTERFVRGDVSRNSEGSGLGLAIVKSFVELQNGVFEIEVDGDLFKAIITWKK